MQTVFTTNHANDRASDRLGLSKGEMERFFRNAYLFGHTAAEYSGERSKYLKSRTVDNITAYAYQDCCCLISDNGSVLTVFPLPKWFKSGKKYDGKEKIRKIKTYSKLHPEYGIRQFCESANGYYENYFEKNEKVA